ncbi:MAG: ABC transporter substrate-binding protein [Candidatus Dormibacteraeota bacterium]|uniref:ABC transporter substrate-binding protein n=1 Tax=Candidatus Dormiibacter inghamiae TaxID=3127013 RepID=A0A934KGJ9_9BACT|nr:ABC transporter substrate-binding protein [Candidatus Dormibacteraeota bacterium]MBJ7606924.1 ABC transporter substrate-binding protein [Candidatus Dormibacteraeota bacterium]
MRKRTLLHQAVVALLALALAACGGGGSSSSTPAASDVGVTKDTITLGGTIALSGPASAYGTIARASDAYFKYTNDHGGVNGRKIVYKYVDDAYNPAQTVPLTKQQVEQDQVFLMYGGLGTQAQTSVREYLNTKKVPQVFVATGATTFSAEHKKYPYTFGWQPTYQGESLIYAQYIQKNLPNAKIGVIYQNDDYGQDYLNGLVKGLGSKANLIVDKQSNEVGAPDLGSQILHLKSSGADTLFIFETPSPAIKSLVTAFKVNWKPTIFLNGVAAPMPYLFAAAKAAGTPAAVESVWSVEYTIDPTDPQQASDAGVTQYRDVMQKYFPSGDLNDAFNVYGVAVAYTMVDVLKRAGANPTRKAVLDILNNLNETNPFLHKSVQVKNTSSDHYTITQEILAKFDGTRYIPQSQVIDVRGQIKFP